MSALPRLDPRSPLAQAAGFSAASYGALALNFIQGLLLYRILGPERVGIWLVLLLLLDYGQHLHLGLNNSVNRQLPLLTGRGQEEEARHHARCGAGLLMLLTLLWIPLAGAAGRLFYTDVLWGAAAVAASTLLEVWLQFFITLLKTQSRFGAVGSVLLARAGANLVLLPMVATWGLPGAYARLVFVTLCAVLVAWGLSPLKPRPLLDRSRWPFFFRDGFPLLAVGMVFGFQLSINKVLLGSFLGKEAVGQVYGLADVVLRLMIVVPGVVGVTSYPRMLRDFGAAGDPSVLRRRILRQTGLVFVVASVAAVVGYLAMPSLVDRWLPAYEPGVKAALMLLPGIVFLSAGVPSSYFLQTIRHQRQHLIVSLSSLGLLVLLDILVLRRGGGGEGVALMTSISYAIYGLGLFAAFLVASRPRRSAMAGELRS